MKKPIIIFCLLVLIISCKEAITTKENNQKAEQIQKIEDPFKFSIKNKADYSESFLSDLQTLPLENIVLDGNLFIEGTDTILFPQFPLMKKQTILTAKKDDLAIALKLKRINQTTIDYKIEITAFGKESETFEGQATIAPTFYWGTENDENPKTGIMYSVDEYIDANEDCYTAIRLGKPNKKSQLLGKLIKNCNGKIQEIELDNFPTFIEK